MDKSELRAFAEYFVKAGFVCDYRQAASVWFVWPKDSKDFNDSSACVVSELPSGVTLARCHVTHSIQLFYGGASNFDGIATFIRKNLWLSDLQITNNRQSPKLLEFKRIQ